MLIDAVERDDLVSALGTSWRSVSDRVMGGISQASLHVDTHAERRCLRLKGDVRLENNGGFVQMALDLAPAGAAVDASSFSGVRLVVAGNTEAYSVHLRTADVSRSWQSYRAHFLTTPAWREFRLPFTQFTPHRLEAAFDPGALRRIGLVAIGRPFHADLCVAEIALYH